MNPYRKLRFLAFFAFTSLCADSQKFLFAVFINDSSYSQNLQSAIKKRYEADAFFLAGNNKKY
jgi:hypothetical protein